MNLDVLGIDHLYVTVSDITRAEAFYDPVMRMLGFRKGVVPVGGEPHIHYFNRVMQYSVRPAHSQGTPADPYRTGALHHLCFRVADAAAVDEAQRRLRELGIEATAPALYPGRPDYYATFFTDPDGIRLEIVCDTQARRLIRQRWNELTDFLHPVQRLLERDAAKGTVAAAARLPLNDELLAFLDQLATFGERNDAHETARPKRMLNITRDTGRLLWILVRASNATRILEVGTSNGYSTIWLADAARSTGGQITTLELNRDKIALARGNLASAGLDALVDILEGRAADTLATLPGPFDIVFLDADRPSYLEYLELVVPKLRSGGLLIADNATSHAEELQDYLRRVKSHPDLFAVTVPIGNGEEIAIKR